MVVLIGLTFIILGLWLFYLNRLYVGIDPLFQSSFVCFIAAFLLLAGAWSNNFHTPLPAPLAIVFPIYLLILFGFIASDMPTYTYKEACAIIEHATKLPTLYPMHEDLSSDGMYVCYTVKGRYVFDPWTGDYSDYWDTSAV